MKIIKIDFLTAIIKNKLKIKILKILRKIILLKLINKKDLLNNSKNNQKDFQALKKSIKMIKIIF
jgi:hypothetical protein